MAPKPDVQAFRRAAYSTSAVRAGEFPPDEGREVAFAGRSNAGKSSAINRITDQRALARTSKTPGRTQMINFFDLGDGWRLVDLPGYGYAKVSEQTRQRWERLVSSYLEHRRSLSGLILVADLRRGLTEQESQLFEWCREGRLPALLLLSKADKLSRGAAARSRAKVSRALADAGLQVDTQLFSAHSGIGVEETREVVAGWLDDAAPMSYV